MTREEKISKRIELRNEMLKLKKQKDTAERLYRSFSNKWMTLKCQYEKLDYELALEDERFKKLKEPEVKEAIKLNIAQILILAEQLGVDLDMNQTEVQV